MSDSNQDHTNGPRSADNDDHFPTIVGLEGAEFAGDRRADPARQERLRAAGQIYDPQVRGTLVHRAVQETVVADEWTYRAIRSVAAWVEPEGLPPIYKLSIRNLLVSAVGSYRNNFLRDDWRLVGIEVPVGAMRLDILWRTRDGLVADELKVGEGYTTGALVADLAQVRGQCTHGSRKWGGQFLGVRLLPLMAPSEQRWVAAR